MEISRKKIRKEKYNEIDQVFLVWFKQMRAKDSIISGPMTIEKTKNFSKLFVIENFEPNNGCL